MLKQESSFLKPLGKQKQKKTQKTKMWVTRFSERCKSVRGLVGKTFHLSLRGPCALTQIK